MLTIFTIPKPFLGHTAMIQRNALGSWCSLRPRCEIILCGDEPGVSDAAKEFGVGHMPDITLNEFGTPLLDSVFSKVAETAKFSLLCFVNADIILLHDILNAVNRIRFKAFLMIGERHNLELTTQIDFREPEWGSDLRNQVQQNGTKATPYYIDYFVFTRNNALEKIPPFIVGRPRWDSFFVYNALRKKTPVINVSQVVTVVHQNHDYQHIPSKNETSENLSEINWEGPEAERNRQISFKYMGNVDHNFTILDSSYFMDESRVRPAYKLAYLRKRWNSLPVFSPKLRPLVTFVGSILDKFR